MATIDAVAELSTSGCYGPSVRPAALVALGLRAGYISKEFPCRQHLHSCSRKSSQRRCAATPKKVN